MRRLRRALDRLRPAFVKGGRLERLGAVFEMIDTFLYTPGDVTHRAPHVRDAIDLKRVMGIVVVAAFPCVLAGMWNTGYQANLAMADLGLDAAPGWRGSLLGALGIGYDPASHWANLWHGLLYFLPIYVVTLVAGGVWEVLFAAVRNHDVNEGFFVTSLLYALILPASIPLWQVALGISFGVVVGKEVFGGTGKNLVNPALAGRAFLFFSYPASMSGDAVWTPVDGFSGATALSLGQSGGVDSIVGGGISWMAAFLGSIQGSLGATSTLACLLGAVILVLTGIASYRIMLGVFLGMVITATAFNLFGTGLGPMAAMPWYWHLVLGGFAFGMVFMATDPVTAAMTDAGRWVFGLLVGFMTVLVRVANPAFPEGIMLAILFANLVAPLIDHVVIRIDVARRARRRPGPETPA